MPNVFNEFAGDGVTTTFNFSMEGGYLSRDFVVFFTRPNDALLDYTPYTGTIVWVSDFTVETSEPIPIGTTFVITRKTAPGALIDFQNTSRLTERNLDTAFNQSLHRTVELDDLTERRMLAQAELTEAATLSALAAESYASVAANAASESQSLAATATSAAVTAVTSAQSAENVAGEALSLIQQAVQGNVDSFNGRGGAVTSQAGDYTPGMVGFVQSGTVGSIYEFSTIPAWSDAFLNGQAMALSNRTQYLRSNQKRTPMLYDTRAQAAAAVSASMQTGQLVLVKADESRGNRGTYNVVSSSGTLDYTGLASDAKSTALVHPGAGAVQTDVQAKLGTIVTPEDFGAKGDFSTDDYLPLQRAFDYLNSIGGGVLYARNKYSLSTQPRMYNNTTLDMCGTGYIRRDFNTSPTGGSLLGTYLALGGGVNIKILNGTLDGNGQNYDQSHNILNLVGGENVLVENVKFLNVVDFHAIDAGDCKRLTVRNCEFLGFHLKTPDRYYSEAIQTDIGVAGLIEDWVIDGCYFGANPLNTNANFGAWPTAVGQHTSRVGDVVRRVVISNNTFNGLTFAGIHPFGWDDVVIKGNHFNNCLAAVLTSMSTRDSRACTNVVISANTFTGGGDNCIYIKDAGEYTVPSDGFVISGNTFTNVITAMRIQNVRNFTVSGNKCNSSTAFVNLSGCSNGVVSNNVTNDSKNLAVYLAGNPSKSIVVSDNTFSTLVGVNAIHVNNASENVTISGNLIVDCSGANAIRASTGAKNVTIQGNTIVSGDLGLVPTSGAIYTTSTVINPVVIDNSLGAGVPNPITYAVSGVGTFKGTCIGSPEGAIPAPIGSLVLRKNGGAGSTLYVKESGTQATGWVAK